MPYVVATDGSSVADEAVQHASRQAIAFDETLVVVHVLRPETELVDGEIVLPGGNKELEAGERTLDQARRLATDVATEHDSDIAVETDLLDGRPADAITDYADEIGAGAIFVGHRGLSEEREQVVGSVAKSVIDKASVPVTVIK